MGVRASAHLGSRPADFERTHQAHRHSAQPLRRDSSGTGRAYLAVSPSAARRRVQHLEGRRAASAALSPGPGRSITSARVASPCAKWRGCTASPTSPTGSGSIQPSSVARGRSATPCLRLWAALSLRKSSALSASRRFFPAMRSNRETVHFCEWTCPKRRSTGGFPCPSAGTTARAVPGNESRKKSNAFAERICMPDEATNEAIEACRRPKTGSPPTRRRAFAPP